jgi:hypothetical protein
VIVGRCWYLMWVGVVVVDIGGESGSLLILEVRRVCCCWYWRCKGVVVDIGGESGLLLILEVRVGCCWYWRWEGVVVDIEGERGLLLILEVRGVCCWHWNLSPPKSTTTPSHLQYQQQHTLTSNVNNNALSPPISTTTHTHLQYQ